MKKFSVTVHWHGMRWQLDGLARHAADLIAALVEEFGPGCMVSVRGFGR